jgi:hypothetical protein
VTAWPDPGRLAARLEGLDPRACDPAHAALLRARMAAATVLEDGDGLRIVGGDETLGLVGRYGSVTLYLPGGPPRRRVLELDRRGHVTGGIRRTRDGKFLSAWLRNVDGALLGIDPRDAEHPLWGASDRILRLPASAVRDAVPLTVSAAVDWDSPDQIPALAEPTRLPPGAGTTVLNLLAALAADRGARPLRYRGPYPTEQLFWALVEGFRFEPTGADPVAVFTRDAEALATRGESREAPLDWTPAPPERLFHDEGIYVQLRNGVEKVWWEGRTYYRADWQGLERREHRVVRRVTTPDGRLAYVVSLEALGRTIEDHLMLDAGGDVVERPARDRDGPEVGPDIPVGELWDDAVSALLPLEATPLLAAALAVVWPGLRVVWGPVARDLVEARGPTVRLSTGLAQVYRTEWATLPATARRAAAQRLVRTVLGLVGAPARARAAEWLASQAGPRQEALLDEAAGLDRRRLAARAAVALGRLLDALEAGATLPG